MKKIKSLFKRNYGDGNQQVYNEVVEGSEWVINGEGWATIKHDGTCCMVKDGELYKRVHRRKTRSGHWSGWLPVGDGPEDQWHREALASSARLRNGTYELIGPKIQNNPYDRNDHFLIKHGCSVIMPPRDFEGIKQWLQNHKVEGIVWHHAEGRMVKIKRSDFGFIWSERETE